MPAAARRAAPAHRADSDAEGVANEGRADDRTADGPAADATLIGAPAGPLRMTFRLRLFGPPQVEIGSTGSKGSTGGIGADSVGGTANGRLGDGAASAADDAPPVPPKIHVLPPERRGQLVAWLALQRAWVGRPELAALLWPGHESRLAATNLRKALHRLQSAPWAAGLQAQGQALRFVATTDVQEFEAALAEGRLAQALSLVRGELLQGFDDPANDAWTERLRFERDRQQAAWRGAALEWLAREESLAALRTEASLSPDDASAAAAPTAAADLAAAEALAARLVAADPLDEAAVAAQMRVLARGGQLAAARTAFRDYADRLQQELGIEPGLAVLALLEELTDASTGQIGVQADVPSNTGHEAGAGVQGDAARSTDPTDPAHVAHVAHVARTPRGPARPGGRASAAPRAGADAGATPATDPDPGFVGRAAELQRIGELLAQQDCAALCLVGPGGVGKTRLAQRALHRLAGDFADGATFVPLEDVVRAADVGVQLAAALGLVLGGAGDAMPQVQRALAGRRMLLVLDNLEQLAADASWLDDLVREAPGLKLLLTSRVRPVARCVWTLPVEGLPCPEPEDHDRREAFDAVRLFVRTAQRFEPALSAATEGAAIVEICRLVEGLPLALELAASFTRVLPCEAIAAELREGAELLRTADPARPARQASMEAVFAQSWHHLAAAEREALARLALFRGGFTAAAARGVAGVSLPVLAALADKSLLRKEGARCHLHPLLQQFALARLDGGDPEGPEHVRTADAHARHFLRWLAESRTRLRHAEPATMREAEAEFENLRAAWRRGARRGPAHLLREATYGLMIFGDHRARRVEVLGLLEEALQAPPAQADEHLAAVLRACMAQLEARLDHHARAEALALHAFAVAERVGDLWTLRQCTNALGTVTVRLGRLDEARRWFERALDLAAQAADLTHRAGTFDNLALLERIRGRLDEALALGLQGLRLHRDAGDSSGEAQCLNNLGVVHILRNETAAAQEVLEEARRLCERHALTATRALVEVNLASIAQSQGDLDRAEAHARQALEASLGARLPASSVDARLGLIAVALARHDLPEAEMHLQAALKTALPLRRTTMLVQVVRMFAEVLAARGEPAAAARLMGYVLAQKPGLVGRERNEVERLQASWSAHAGPMPAWAGPAIEALAERILVEAPARQAALVAELRGDG